jgi:hypothetical protein
MKRATGLLLGFISLVVMVAFSPVFAQSSTTASLTLYGGGYTGATSVTAATGTPFTYKWTSTNAAGGKAALQIFHDVNATSPANPVASDPCGNTSGDFSVYISGTSGTFGPTPIAACEAGYTYEITYSVTDGNNQTVQALPLFIAVTGTATATTPASSSCSTNASTYAAPTTQTIMATLPNMSPFPVVTMDSYMAQTVQGDLSNPSAYTKNPLPSGIPSKANIISDMITLVNNRCNFYPSICTGIDQTAMGTQYGNLLINNLEAICASPYGNGLTGSIYDNYNGASSSGGTTPTPTSSPTPTSTPTTPTQITTPTLAPSGPGTPGNLNTAVSSANNAVNSALQSYTAQLAGILSQISGTGNSSIATQPNMFDATRPASTGGVSASLTANGQTALVIPVGASTTYSWNSQGGSQFASSLTIYNNAGVAVPADGCGNTPTNNWVITGASGSLSATPIQCQAGYGYVITYTVTDASGDTVPARLVIVVAPSGTSPVSASLTINGQTALSVPVGASTTYNWSSVGGSQFSSSLNIYNSAGVAVSADACGNTSSSNWAINTANGSLAAVPVQCQAGYDYVISYRVTSASGADATSQLSIAVTGGSTASGVTASFPATILVTASTLNVRSAPNTTAALAGSQTLNAGDEFTAVNEVAGESVNGNDLWWVSSAGNYVWSGGTQVAGSIGTTPSGGGTTAPPALPAPVIKTVTIEPGAGITGAGGQYPVTYSYLADGEVRAVFTYLGQSYATQPLYDGYEGPSPELVQADGSFTPPTLNPGSSAYFTLEDLVDYIYIDSPSPIVISPGLTFVTPLDVPANAFVLVKSSVSNVPVATSYNYTGGPGLYYLDMDAGGDLVGVTPVNVSNGVVTTGTEIPIQQPISAPVCQSGVVSSTITYAVGGSESGGSTTYSCTYNANVCAAPGTNATSTLSLFSNNGSDAVPGIHDNYQITTYCGTDAAFCSNVSDGVSTALAAYNAIDGAAQGTAVSSLDDLSPTAEQIVVISLHGTLNLVNGNDTYIANPTQQQIASSTALAITDLPFLDISGIENIPYAPQGSNACFVYFFESTNTKLIGGDFTSVAIHEMGHCFGVAHNNLVSNVMDTTDFSLTITPQMQQALVDLHSGTPVNLANYCTTPTISCVCGAVGKIDVFLFGRSGVNGGATCTISFNGTTETSFVPNSSLLTVESQNGINPLTCPSIPVTPNPTNTNNTCFNLPDGSVSCNCEAGYTPSGSTCVESDTCSQNPDAAGCINFCASNPSDPSCNACTQNPNSSACHMCPANQSWSTVSNQCLQNGASASNVCFKNIDNTSSCTCDAEDGYIQSGNTCVLAPVSTPAPTTYSCQSDGSCIPDAGGFYTNSSCDDACFAD